MQALLGALPLIMSGANFVGGCPEDDCGTLGAKYYSLTNLYGVLLSFYATFVSAVSVLYIYIESMSYEHVHPVCSNLRCRCVSELNYKPSTQSVVSDMR